MTWRLAQLDQTTPEDRSKQPSFWGSLPAMLMSSAPIETILVLSGKNYPEELGKRAETFSIILPKLPQQPSSFWTGRKISKTSPLSKCYLRVALRVLHSWETAHHPRISLLNAQSPKNTGFSSWIISGCQPGWKGSRRLVNPISNAKGFLAPHLRQAAPDMPGRRCLAKHSLSFYELVVPLQESLKPAAFQWKPWLSNLRDFFQPRVSSPSTMCWWLTIKG